MSIRTDSVSSAALVLSRYRPVILFAAGLAAAYGIYIFQGHLSASGSRAGSHTTLRRSNAITRGNRRVRRDTLDQGTGESNGASGQGATAVGNGGDEATQAQLEALWEDMSFGTYPVTDSTGQEREITLRLSLLPTRDQLMSEYGYDSTQAQMHYDMIEIQYLMSIAVTQPVNLSSNISVDAQVELLRGFLMRRGIREALINQVFRAFAVSSAPPRQEPEPEPEPESESEPERLQLPDTPQEQESDAPSRGPQDQGARGGQSLLHLLYHIAEDQARREGYVHRGVTCNSCGSMPIRGIRYRCANCSDFDLCENCETLQLHPKTHLFYKVRIPAPFLANPKQAQPVWYPGKPSRLPHSLPKALSQRLVKETGYENAEVDALWDQFKCLAATDWRDDPNQLRMAIDRRTFDKCFCPGNVSRIRPPQLIYDRIFAFYDVNGDGLIGFEEFINGLASLSNKNKDDRLQRIYQSYDIDGDGFIDRRDFLRMFRAYYALNKELTEEMILGMEDNDNDEINARDVIFGGQPISSIFATTMPPPMTSRYGEGKARNARGDLELVDGLGVVYESGDNTADRREVVAEAAERAVAAAATEARQGRPWPPHDPDLEVETLDLLEQAMSGAAAAVRAPSSIGDVADPVLDDEGRSDDGNSDEDDRDEANREDGGDGEVREVCSCGDAWPPKWVTSEDVKAALGPGAPKTENIRNGDDRKKVLGVAMTRLAEEEKQKRERIRRQAWEERWRRRRFYVDEEEGALPPEGYSNDDETASLHNHDGERIEANASSLASPYGSRPPSPRSRSSSKVRFRDNPTDSTHETRSNPSTSSRSIPYGERWGGYEIPEAEKDIGREILYQFTQQGLNEMLDPLFREKEDLALEVFATRYERSRYRHLCVRPEEKPPTSLEEVEAEGPPTAPRAHTPPADDPVSDAGDLLAPESSPPLAVFGPGSDSLPGDADAGSASSGSHSRSSPLEQSSFDGPLSSSTDEPASTVDIRTPKQDELPPTDKKSTVTDSFSDKQQETTSADGTAYDPTMPQFRRNSDVSTPTPVVTTTSPFHTEQSPDHSLSPAAPPIIPRHRPEPGSGNDMLGSDMPKANGVPKAPQDTQEPSASRLERLRFLNGVEDEIKERGGPGRLDFPEFRRLMDSDKGKRLGFLASWVEMASF
ncbi:MAG: hypothetical protein M1815_004502 [Lichina confinis]|nr:MAG: hypothetical protein M1815_004502 [Lichina confinis]